MATTTATRSHSAEKDNFSVSRGGSVASMVIAFMSVLALCVAWRLYQQAYAFEYGLDKNAPEFATTWTALFVVNMTVLPLLAVVWYMRMWSTANKKPASQMTRQDEGKRLWMVWLLVGAMTAAVFAGGSYFAEEDAAWHQVVMRDSAFTPSHTVLFYGIFPLMIYMAVGIYIYGRTRLPHIYGGKRFPVSFGLIIGGSVLLMFQVAMNEFGHSFFQGEELFSAPLHWPFVTFGYLLAGLFAVWFETLPRIMELAKQERAELEGTAAPVAASTETSVNA